MNLHDELGRHGADAADESARRLSSSDVRSALGARVRRGRRRRAVGGGVGAVAGIALVAVGAWSVLLGVPTDAQPAATIDADLESRGTTYEVDGAAIVDPAIPIDLRQPDELRCGTPVELDEGPTVHDTSVTRDGVTVAALSVSSATPEEVTEPWLSGLDEDARGGAWDGLVAEDPTAIDVNTAQQVFESQVVVDDNPDLYWTAIPLLMHDGEIVSIGVSKGGDAGETDPVRLWTAGPGTCGAEGASGDLDDGVYEPVLVTQFWSLSTPGALATVVFSAGEIEYTGLGEATEESEADLGAAPDADNLPALGSDEYLASGAGVRGVSGGLSCDNVLDAVDSYGEGGQSPESPPVPSWIETGRLYGWGDDALVGGYPIPITTADEEWAESLGDLVPGEQDGPSQLVLTADGESWVFGVRWYERDDLPEDEPGWFIELSQNWECGNPDIIGDGAYGAQLFYGDSQGQRVADLSPIRVVSGVPSLPEIDAQG